MPRHTPQHKLEGIVEYLKHQSEFRIRSQSKNIGHFYIYIVTCALPRYALHSFFPSYFRTSFKSLHCPFLLSHPSLSLAVRIALRKTRLATLSLPLLQQVPRFRACEHTHTYAHDNIQRAQPVEYARIYNELALARRNKNWSRWGKNNAGPLSVRSGACTERGREKERAAYVYSYWDNEKSCAHV